MYTKKTNKNKLNWNILVLLELKDAILVFLAVNDDTDSNKNDHVMVKWLFSNKYAQDIEYLWEYKHVSLSSK